MKAMLLCAGLGTRLKPFTDHHPKALAIVNGKTLLERNINYLKKYGIQEVVINVHHFSNQILDFLKANDNFGLSVEISDETEEVLETGGGLLNAKSFLEKEDFILMNVDILTDLDLNQLIEFHQNNEPLVTLAVSDRESSRKLLFNEYNELQGWKNYKTREEINISEDPLHELAFSGIHLINPFIFELMTQTGKFSIMTTYMELMQNEIILGFDHSGGKLIDVGRPESVKAAEKAFK